MLLSVDAKAAVRMLVSMRRAKLIQVLRSAVRAHPGHVGGDGSAQTFCGENLWVPFLAIGFEPRWQQHTKTLAAVWRVF